MRNSALAVAQGAKIAYQTIVKTSERAFASSLVCLISVVAMRHIARYPGE
jgi:hypothetical protein